MEHSFSVDVAKSYGVSTALIYNILREEVIYNKINEINKIDGKFWVKLSIEYLSILLPYLGKSSIYRSLKKLNLIPEIDIIKPTGMDRSFFYTINSL